MATTDRALKEGQLHVKQNKFGKKWKRCFVLLYPDSPFGVARLEFYDWKDGTLPGEKFHTRKATDRKVIRLAECVHVAPAPAESAHKENMVAFIIETSEKTILLSTEPTKCEEWVQALSEAAFPANSNGGKPEKEILGTPVLEMSVNSIYLSRDQVSEFWVTIQRTEAAERCSLRGFYILRAESDCLILKHPDTKETLFSWPYKLLRRYGRDKVMFSFEAGRRCASGPGNFTFETSQGHEIFQKVESSIRVHQGSENHLSGPTLDTEAPADYQSSDTIMTEISSLLSKKEMEENALKGRVLPNLPAGKMGQPQHLLDPIIPGKSSTPPRSPVFHHSEDSEHLTVYSEPKDSVKGPKPNFDPLYSDPVDSLCKKDLTSNMEKDASPLYSDLYEQVGYEVVGGGVSTNKYPPGREEHIYDEPEGIVHSEDPPQLYSEVHLERGAWRKQVNDERFDHEYPNIQKTEEYSVPNQAQRSQARPKTGPKPVLAPKPQRIVLPKSTGKDQDLEKSPIPITQSNSNNNNNNCNIEALYSQVLKPGNNKSAKLQAAPPISATNQPQPAPAITPFQQYQTAPPLPPMNKPNFIPPIIPINKPQSSPRILPMNKLQSFPLIPMNKPQLPPPILPINKPQTTSKSEVKPCSLLTTSAKLHSALVNEKTLPLTVPEGSNIPFPPVPVTSQTINPPSLAQPHANNGMDPKPVSEKDVAVIYEDMGFL